MEIRFSVSEISSVDKLIGYFIIFECRRSPLRVRLFAILLGDAGSVSSNTLM